MSGNSINTRFVYLISLIAAVGGILFGYDTAVISGAIGFLQTHFDLTPALKGWAASSALIGCMIGASLAGISSDRYGRKKIMMISAIFFAISAIGSAIPPNLTWFVIARIIGGVGVGAASMLSPLYISEIAPAKIRGKLITLNQIGIVSGIVLIYFVNSLIAGNSTETWNISIGWRWMFASELIPSLLFFFLLIAIPESPRWLIKQGRNAEALTTLIKINGEQKAKTELTEIISTIGEKTATLAMLFKPGIRIAFFIGIFLALFSQTTGINAIMYYAPEIFKEAGFGSGSALRQTVILGANNLFFTFVAFWLVDKVGRKTLLLIGAIGMAITLFLIGGAFQTGLSHGPWVLIFILLFGAFFSASFGPVTWIVIAEIFPTRIRGRAMAISTVTIWGACYLVSQSFPVLIAEVGAAFTFWIFMMFVLCSLIFVWWVIPETKGRSLEEIEKSWIKK